MQAEVVFESNKLTKFLKDVEHRAGAPEKNRDIVYSIAILVHRDIIEHFKKEEGPRGGWKEWSTGHARRARKAGRKKILQWSGRMRNTFQPTSYKVSTGMITWYNNAQTKGVAPRSIKLKDGSTKKTKGSKPYPYAWGHNYGDGKLPARPFMWLSNKYFDLIAKVVLDKIIGKD